MSNKQNLSLKIDGSHAQEVVQTMYDGEIGAGYIRFCDCKSGGTRDIMNETIHSLLYDVDFTSSHVIGLEILDFPVSGFQRGTLSADLNYTELTEKQKESVLNRFLQN